MTEKIFFLSQFHKLDMNKRYIQQNLTHNKQNQLLLVKIGQLNFGILKSFEKSVQNSAEGFDYIDAVQYSPDGMLIYYCKYNRASLFIVSLQTGEQIDQIILDFKHLRCASAEDICYFIQYDLNTKIFIEILFLESFKCYLNIYQSQNCRLFRLLCYALGGRKKIDEYLIILLNDNYQVKYFVEQKSSNIQFSYYTNFLYYFSDGSQQKTISTKQICIQEIQENFLKKQVSPQFGHNEIIKQFVVKSDDKFIISHGQFRLYIWNIESQLHQQIDIGVECFFISQTVNQYLFLRTANKLLFYETETYQQVGSQSSYNIDEVVFCPNRDQFFTIGGDRLLKLWNIDKEKSNEKYYVFNEGLVIPNYVMQGSLLDNIKWDKSRIQSHLKFDLQNLWSQKMK